MTQSPIAQRSPKRVWIIVGSILLVVFAMAGIQQLLAPVESAAVASFPVRQGEFVISLKLKGGELEAIEAVEIRAPRVHGQLKITELFPEGDRVEIGDLLIEFEKSESEKRVTEAQQELAAAEAERVQKLATQRVEIGRLEADIENRGAELRLAELQVEKMKFESFIEKEEVKLGAKQASLSLQQAIDKLEAQRIIDGAERKKQDIQVDGRQRNLDKATEDFENLSVHAEHPGIVVYDKIWKGGRIEKIRVGDQPWGGQSLMSLPDLSQMRVKTYVNEVDVDKLKEGQQALVQLDALPGPVFVGKITHIATLGHEREGDRNVKIFDVEIGLDKADGRLKPGMSAVSKIIIETVPERSEAADFDSVQPPPTEKEFVGYPLYIPLDAVSDKNGKTLVYVVGGSANEEREIVLGARNDNFVIVEEGLGPDDRVALRDPTLVLEDLGGMPTDSESATPGIE